MSSNFAVVNSDGLVVSRIVIEHDGFGRPLNMVEGEGLVPFTIPDMTLVLDDGTAQIGGTYVKKKFKPAPPEEMVAQTQFSPLEFMDRFTEAEQLAIVTAAMQSPQIKLWYDRMLAATWVDITNGRTIDGVNSLVAGGLLTAKRAEEVLT